MDHSTPLFLGIDVGTGGVRALAVSGTGDVAAQASVPFGAIDSTPQPSWHEQPPKAWWATVCQATQALVESLHQTGYGLEQLAAVAVDGTSGTLAALDSAGEPLRPGLMYNDARSPAEAEELNGRAGEFCQKLGYRFAASFALAKILWLQNHEPELFERTALFVHQADYVLGLLSGQRGLSDYSNALKTGYDLVDDCWPEWLVRMTAVAQRLPRVVAPGTPVGQLSAVAAEKTGLPKGLTVVTGASDGTAACLASGLTRPGNYNSTLGTTLVFKGISGTICRHPEGAIYCHKLPGGLWLPGAASNTGGEWVGQWFAGSDPAALDQAAATRLPSRYLAWPLVRRGERFPVVRPQAEGFVTPEPDQTADRYAACLQGVAMIERLGYTVLDQAIGTSGGEVFSTGGGSRSDVWMQCRSDMTGRIVHRPACPESAFGAAVLAASGSYFGSVAEATRSLVRLERSFTPDLSAKGQNDEVYEQFLGQLKTRGYL